MIDRFALTGPISCELNLTGRCNLSCRHCSSVSGPAYTNDMSTDQWRSLINHLANDVRVFKLIFTGGEPLVREDFFELLALCTSNRIVVSLLTNATLVTRDVAARLAGERGVKSATVSLDGAGAATHDALRGRGAFETALNGIECLIDAGVPVSCSCIVSRLNKHELPAIACLAADLGLRMTFNRVTLVGRAKADTNLFALNKGEWDRVFDEVMSLKRELPSVSGGTVLEWPKLAAELARKAALPQTTKSTLAHCSICKEDVAITPDGWVVPCNNMWEYRIGNVLENDFLSIYHSEKAQRVRDLSGLSAVDLEECQGCQYAAICSAGCRARAYSRTGSLTGVDATLCLRRYMAAGDDAVF